MSLFTRNNDAISEAEKGERIAPASSRPKPSLKRASFTACRW